VPGNIGEGRKNCSVEEKKKNCSAKYMCPAISGRGGKTVLLKKKKRIVQQNKCVCIPILNK
jgi:hypothetical protein